MYGYPEIARVLIDKMTPADLGLLNRQGKTALDYDISVKKSGTHRYVDRITL
jgi:hypothetical protein